MPGKRKESKVRIVWYSSEKRRYGPVELGVLIPARKYESSEIGDPIEIILSHIEKGSKMKEGDFYEIKVEAPGITEIVGESPKYKSQRGLFMKPAKLLRIGILKKESLKTTSEGEYLIVPLDQLEWYDVEDDVYVYEGQLNADNDVIGVLIETEEGSRFIIPAGRDKLLRDVLSQREDSRE